MITKEQAQILANLFNEEILPALNEYQEELDNMYEIAKQINGDDYTTKIVAENIFSDIKIDGELCPVVNRKSPTEGNTHDLLTPQKITTELLPSKNNNYFVDFDIKNKKTYSQIDSSTNHNLAMAV